MALSPKPPAMSCPTSRVRTRALSCFAKRLSWRSDAPVSPISATLRASYPAVDSELTPAARLRLVASTPQAAEFLGARARSILGPDVDLQVVVHP